MKADAVMYCRFLGRCDGFFFLSFVYFKGVFYTYVLNPELDG